MHSESERYVLQEIRQRALQRFDHVRRHHRLTQAIDYTLDALQEVTELSRNELETIAAEVTVSMDADQDSFLSIRNQLLMVSTAFVAMAIVIGGLVWWIV